MKAHHFAACLAAFGFSAATTDAGAQVVANLADADHLVDRSLTLAPGASVTIATTGCSGTEDTVLHLLERVSPTSATFYTVAYNDDFAGTLCSSITATNNTGSSRNLVLLAVAYSGTPAVVDLSFTYAGGGTSVTETNLTVRGVRRLGAWGASDRTAPLNRRPTLVMTKPLSPIEGGGVGGTGIKDTIVYAINRSIGAVSYSDDDGGIARYSSINLGTSNRCTSSTQCEIVAGGYDENELGKITIWNNQLGDNVNYNIGDCDYDGVGDEIEAYYGTGNCNSDHDGDGILDGYEYLGVPATSGLAGGDASLVMPHRYASPVMPDVFVEVDYMNLPGNHTHIPYPSGGVIFGDLGSQMALTFANSGYSGKNIALHLEVDQDIGHTDFLDIEPCAAGLANRISLRQLKQSAAWFNPLKASIYRYAVSGHQRYDAYSAGGGCAASNSSGRGELWGNDFVIAASAGAFTNDNTFGTYMHELGHNLNLDHHGNDSPAAGSRSCVHSSVMNYRYQFGGVDNNPADFREQYTYSNFTCDASSSVSPGGGCANTCNASKCVPSGQASAKTGCPGGISNGTCDCDYNEWGSELNIYQQAGSGYFASGAEREAEARDYGLGLGTGSRARLSGRLDERRSKLTERGLREGKEYVVDSRSGKVYATEEE